MTQKDNQKNAKPAEQERWELAKLLRQGSRELSRQLNQKKTR